VIGGGVAGVELALAMDHRLREARRHAPAGTVIEAGRPAVRPGRGRADQPAGASGAGADPLIAGARVVEIRADAVTLDDGRVLPSDFTLARRARGRRAGCGTGLPLVDGFIESDRGCWSPAMTIVRRGRLRAHGPRAAAQGRGLCRAAGAGAGPQPARRAVGGVDADLPPAEGLSEADLDRGPGRGGRQVGAEAGRRAAVAAEGPDRPALHATASPACPRQGRRRCRGSTPRGWPRRWATAALRRLRAKVGAGGLGPRAGRPAPARTRRRAGGRGRRCRGAGLRRACR
jgi:hypothetical protein